MDNVLIQHCICRSPNDIDVEMHAEYRRHSYVTTKILIWNRTWITQNWLRDRQTEQIGFGLLIPDRGV